MSVPVPSSRARLRRCLSLLLPCPGLGEYVDVTLEALLSTECDPPEDEGGALAPLGGGGARTAAHA